MYLNKSNKEKNMNTEEYFLIEDTNVNSENIRIPELDKKELDTIQEYIEFARHIQ